MKAFKPCPFCEVNANTAIVEVSNVTLSFALIVHVNLDFSIKIMKMSNQTLNQKICLTKEEANK